MVVLRAIIPLFMAGQNTCQVITIALAQSSTTYARFLWLLLFLYVALGFGRKLAQFVTNPPSLQMLQYSAFLMKCF
jgi:hypothetical protein